MGEQQPRLFIPALAPLYRAIESLAWPLVRISASWAVFVHGYGKISTPNGMTQAVASMAKNGFEPAFFLAYLVLCMELVGSVCVMLGLFTRFFAIGLAIESTVIGVFVLSPNGFGANKNGYEMVAIWAIIFISIAIRGGGPWSLDRKIGVEL